RFREVRQGRQSRRGRQPGRRPRQRVCVPHHDPITPAKPTGGTASRGGEDRARTERRAEAEVRRGRGRGAGRRRGPAGRRGNGKGTEAEPAEGRADRAVRRAAKTKTGPFSDFESTPQPFRSGNDPVHAWITPRSQNLFPYSPLFGVICLTSRRTLPKEQ